MRVLAHLARADPALMTYVLQINSGELLLTNYHRILVFQGVNQGCHNRAIHPYNKLMNTHKQSFIIYYLLRIFLLAVKC